MIKLRDYQEKALEYVDKPTVLLDCAVGTGKTLMALALAKEQGHQLQVIIVPAPLTYQWASEAEKIGFRNIKVLDDPPRVRKIFEIKTPLCLIMSYNIFRSDFERLFKQLKPYSTKFTLIIDEAQILKNQRNKIYKQILKMKRLLNPQVILLSGTIITEPIDAYAILKILNPGCYQNLLHFKAKHVAKEDYWGNILEYKNLELLEKNMAENSYKVSSEVLSLDEPIIKPIPYRLRHMKLYKQIVEEQLIELEDEVVDLTMLNNIFHIAQVAVHDPVNIIGSGRIKPFKFFIDFLEKGLDISGKVIIFTRYRNTTETLSRILKAPFVYGGMTKEERDLAFKKFKEDSQYLVLNLQSGGVGLDGLQHHCHTMVFADLPYTPAEFEQAVGRLQRSGQKQPVFVYVPYALGTVQEAIWKRINKRAQVLKKITKNQLADLLLARDLQE